MSGNRRGAGRKLHAHVHVDENVRNPIIIMARMVDKMIPGIGSGVTVIAARYIHGIRGRMNHGINLDGCWIIWHSSKVKGPSNVFGSSKALKWSSIAAANDGRRQDHQWHKEPHRLSGV